MDAGLDRQTGMRTAELTLATENRYQRPGRAKRSSMRSKDA